MLAVRWWLGQWLIGSATMTVANNASFGTDVRLEDELRRVMKQSLSPLNALETDSDPLNALDPALIHIFRLSSSKYIPFGVKD